MMLSTRVLRPNSYRLVNHASLFTKPSRKPTSFHALPQAIRRRLISSSEPTPSGKSSPESRFSRLVSRSPKFLQPWLAPIVNAPASHIVSFIVLHELTAVIPVAGLAAVFHTTGWLPSWFGEGKWVKEGLEKYGRYARKKGWVTDVQEKRAEQAVESERIGSEDSAQNRSWKGKLKSWRENRKTQETKESMKSRLGRVLGNTEVVTRWLVELSTAYAVVKILFYPRIALCAWATPWFARWAVVPLTNRLGRGTLGRWYSRGKTGDRH